MSLKILVFNWKDISHPKAGGAEVVTHELLKRLAINKYKVTLIVGSYPGASKFETIDGIKIIRLGGLATHYPLAIWYYLTNLRNQFDIIIEEINTVPYFLNFFKGKEKVFLLYHMLARQIWFHEFFQPLSTIGFLIEPIYTWVQSRFRNTVITISESSKKDLIRFRFREIDIKIISVGIENKPLNKITDSKTKENKFTILYHGSLRKMKRPIEVFKSFQVFLDLLKKKDTKSQNQVQLWVSGGGDQTQLKEFAKKHNFLGKVKFFGRTSQKKKLELMQKASVLAVTSLKEGWGLVVTEANSMATPAVVYDVDGLRDSANFDGNFVIPEDSQALGQKFFELFINFTKDLKKYNRLRAKVLESSKKINFDKAYKDFCKVVFD